MAESGGHFERQRALVLSGAAGVLPAPALRVWIIMNQHADTQAEAFPSIARIAKLANQERRSTERALQCLVEAGWLTRVRAGGGRGQATTYRLETPAYEPVDLGETPSLGAGDNSQNPVTGNRGFSENPVSQCRETPAPSVAKPRRPVTPYQPCDQTTISLGKPRTPKPRLPVTGLRPDVAAFLTLKGIRVDDPMARNLQNLTVEELRRVWVAIVNTPRVKSREGLFASTLRDAQRLRGMLARRAS